MKKYKLVRTTTLRTDSLSLIKDEVDAVFSHPVDINEVINSGEVLVQETSTPDRDAETIIKIESHE